VTPGIAIYSVKPIAKPPRTDVVCHWHQDDAYYTKLSESKTRMSVWVPLQAAHERNGRLRIVPCSHRRGLQEHRTKESGQCRLSMTSPTLGWCTDKSGSRPSTSRRRGP
jgi:hypothetical protein